MQSSVSPGGSQGRASISPGAHSGGGGSASSSRQSPSAEDGKPLLPAMTTITGKPLPSRGRGSMFAKLATTSTSEMPSGGGVGGGGGGGSGSGRTSAERQLAQQIEAVRIEDIQPVKELSATAARKSVTEAGGSSDGARTAAQTTSGDSGSKATTQYLSVASTATKSVERAMDELKVETILRQSPVRRAGEAGVRTTFSTNYVRLKCKNAGLYQYTVQYDPPVDSQFIRCKMVSSGLRDIIGTVKLFDGHTLFLPHLLKDQVSERDLWEGFVLKV
jgi:hypothetical protein